MKERPLTFHHDDNPQPVDLDETQRQGAFKEARDLQFAAGELAGQIKNKTLKKGMCNTFMNLLESYTVKLHELFDYKSELKEEYKKRFAEIRALNAENRKLRKHLGEKVSPEDVREQMKNFHDIINKWWDKEGLGFVPEIYFTGFVCRVKISGTLSLHFPPTQPNYLKNKGYSLIQSEGNSYNLAHSEKNIQILGAEITKRFPSAKISSIDVSNYQGMHIRDVTFHIHEFTDIPEK